MSTPCASTTSRRYLHAEGVTVDCPGIGELSFDIAYGGNYYAILEPQKNYRDMADFPPGDILRLSPILRRLLNEQLDVVHPENPTIKGVSHILWTGKPKNPKAHGAQCGVLWRQGDRPQSLRHRHLGAHGAAGRQGQAEGGRRFHP